MSDKELLKAESQFGKYLPYLQKRNVVVAARMAEQFTLLSDISKISFMSRFWSSKDTDKGYHAACSFMPILSYKSIKDYIEANEPKGVWQNIEDILYGYAPHELQRFVYPVNIIKEDYVQRAKFIDEFLDDKLKDPLRKNAYFSEPENLKPFEKARLENQSVIDQLIELKRRNQEDMQIILKSRAGITIDDEAENEGGKL